MRAAAALTTLLAIVLAAPALAQVRFDDPPTDPGAPTTSDPIVARLIVPIACAEPTFDVQVETVQAGVIDLVYTYPELDCPTLPTDTPRTVAIGTLAAGTYTLRVSNSRSASPSPDDLATVTVGPSTCETNPALPAAAPADATLCIDGRFAVSVEWTVDASSGLGHAVPLTAETGAFWFFNAANVEVLVKVLDACSYNQRFWVFVS